MDIKFNLVQRQIFTHQHIQGLNMLSMNVFELSKYIDEMALENPVLIVDDSAVPEAEKSNLISKLQWLEATDEQNRAYYKAYSENGGIEGLYESAAQPPKSLSEFLSEQICYINLSEQEAEICLLIIHRLDDNGYLDKDFYLYEEFAGNSAQLLENCVLAVQSLEPTGIGARSISECLMLQLAAKGIEDEIILSMVENDLEMLGKKQFVKLAKKYDVTQNVISDYFDIISQLNPKPGAGYTGDIYHNYIIPDAVIGKVCGEFVIELNTWSVPRISINKTYLDKYNTVEDIKTKRYIEEKVKQARNIANNMAKRNETLLKVTQEILERQKDFFEKGEGNIRPLKMSDVAENLSVHPSTISRTVKGKYLQCGFGVFSYRYFFSTELSSVSGEGESAEKIKATIKNLVLAEDKECPHSDQKIEQLLNKSGIQIKRRTVAKYRAELKIPPAFMRKK